MYSEVNTVHYVVPAYFYVIHNIKDVQLINKLTTLCTVAHYHVNNC